jgi:cytochrome b6-f complex iron-sulfur subunit
MNRRSFINWFSSGVAALWAGVTLAAGAALRFLYPKAYYEPPHSFTIGGPADFRLGPPTLVSNEKLFVSRDEKSGMRCMTAVCTHLGCTVEWFGTDRQFHCPCHGSIYSADGKVVRGPAPLQLDHFELDITSEGEVRVERRRVVPASRRLKV